MSNDFWKPKKRSSIMDMIKTVLNKKDEYQKGKVPIKKGCKNTQCYCTGECQEIIGWRDKLPFE